VTCLFSAYLVGCVKAKSGVNYIAFAKIW